MRLYKYCDLHGINILKSKEIRVTPPNDFNDPFEFLPTVKSIEKKKINPLFVNHRAKYYVNKISQHICLLCLSAVPTSLLMWAHYTDKFQGMVIEFDSSSVPFRENWPLFRVKYTNKRFRIIEKNGQRISKGDTLDLAKNKAKHWKYEKEYRCFFRKSECTDRTVNGKKMYFAKIDSDMITKIIIGGKMPSNIISDIKNLLKLPEFQHIEQSVALMDWKKYAIKIFNNKDYQELKLLTTRST